MEYFNENEFFSNLSGKNLLIVEDKDQPHLITRIKQASFGDCFFFSEEQTFSDLMNEVNQPSLFGGEKVMIILNCDSYKDEDWKVALAQEDTMMFFFRKSSNKALEERFKASGSTLKLTAEKPWDRKNRLVQEVVYTIHKDGIQISQPTAYRFVERVHNDLQLFHGELQKLRLYAKGKVKIEDADIDAVVKPLPEENLFKVSEELVWKGLMTKEFTLDGVSTLLQILGSLRFQAYLGLKILSHEDIKLPPWQEKKYKQKAIYLGDAYFKKILTLLYKAEQRAKQSSIQPAHIFDILSLELCGHYLKNQKTAAGFVKS